MLMAKEVTGSVWFDCMQGSDCFVDPCCGELSAPIVMLTFVSESDDMHNSSSESPAEETSPCVYIKFNKHICRHYIIRGEINFCFT